MITLNEILNLPEYKFIYTEKRLKNNIAFLTFGGSYAYGTNVEGSDIDVRGCTLNLKTDLIGLTKFEQYIDNKTDTTIYSFNKLISLLSACNPNVIELLGCKEAMYSNMSYAGKLLLDNKKLFLSKRAASSFGGYATAQLRRLQTYSARAEIDESKKIEFIIKTIMSGIEKVENAHNVPHGLFEVKNNNGMICFGICRTKDIHEIYSMIENISVGDLQGFLGEINGIVKSYDTLTGRNHRAKQKSDKQLNKHAMHLIRLYLMAFDILENEEIKTYRYDDRQMLLEIRNGKYQLQDGTFSEELFELVNIYEKRLEYDKNNTSLPDCPDMNKIQDIVMEVNEKIINGE